MHVDRCKSCNNIVIFNDENECPVCVKGDKQIGICPKCGKFIGTKKCMFCDTEMVSTWLSLSEVLPMSQNEQNDYVKNLIKEHFQDTYDPELAKERESKECPFVYADYVSDNVSDNAVTCPYCKSNNTKKITVGSKAVHTAIFGIFSMGRNSKNYHCNSCGSDF